MRRFGDRYAVEGTAVAVEGSDAHYDRVAPELAEELCLLLDYPGFTTGVAWHRSL